MKRKSTTVKKGSATKKRRTTGDYQKGRELARTPKQELKAFDVAAHNLAYAPIAGPPSFETLNACINGAELYQRVGRKIYMKSLHIRGIMNSTGVATPGLGRIIVYYDSQPNAAVPTIQGLIQDSNVAAGTTADSEINLINRQRFKILRDYDMILPSATAAANVGVGTIMDPIYHTLNINWFIKLKGLETVYNATNGGTIADITSGAIGITAFVDGNATNWAFAYSSRLRYYD